MRSPKFSKRILASATLLTVGLATGATGIQQLFSSSIGDLTAICLCFLGSTLIGAGTLCLLHRTTAGALGGFIVAGILSLDPMPTSRDPVNANKTFKEVAEEIWGVSYSLDRANTADSIPSQPSNPTDQK